jgi:MSHA biogenesis protein MshQ
VYGFIKKIFFYSAIGLVCSSNLYAATVRLNSGGGLNAGDGLHTYIEDTTQIQVRRLNNTGQLYNPNAIPSNTQLDNGIYLRANGGLIGPDHFGFPSTLTPTAYINRTVSTPAPATISQGVTQSTTSQFSAPRFSTLVAGPSVTVNWKYTYPLDYITAEVTLVIPLGYPISSSNPVRYYHAVDTYLGGDDRGCGVRYTDTNGRQIVGTYPLSGGTNAPCPSSSSLPANLDVVESFRERNRSFDHYCVGAWDSFWSSSNNACAIAKTNSLSDTISTTKIDTGIAIEYDFILPGTYTFSYDFVVGSTFVPNYDHLEIRHSGTGTLCPVDIQVLACLSSTVPCPSNQLVSTGLLTGDITVSPTTPAVTANPDSTFNLGSNASIDTVTITGSAAATYTLGASGLTKAPLSGVKCWNTATNSQSCSFTFTNTPCVDKFECMENSVTYNNLTTTPAARNPLYTKLLGNDFDIDIVAVLANGTQSTGYNAALGLIVDLVVEDINTKTCGVNQTDIVATKIVPFVASDNGRKKVTFAAIDALLGAYPKVSNPILRCRVRDITLNKTGCSSDNFAVRPPALSITSNNASQTQQSLTPSPTSVPVFRASRDPFNLTATSGESGYNGTPKIKLRDPLITPPYLTPYTPLFAHPGAPSVGVVSGLFTPAVSGSSSGSAFTYSEVGHFKFRPYDVYDDTFTSVDNAKGDCENSALAFDNNGSGTPKKYGCRFGNTGESYYFGRFIPDHFTLIPGTPTTLGCNGFVYYGQDPGVVTTFRMNAENAATTPTITQNYTGDYARFNLAVWNNYQFTATPLNGATLGPSQITNPPPASGTWANGVANVTARHRLSRPAAAIGPQSVTISARPQEVDGIVTITSDQTALTGGVQYRFGRIAITPAHGSELLPLQVQIESQFWNGTTFIRSTGDSCTSIDPRTVVMRNYQGNLNACETRLTGGPLMNNGVLNMSLSAPGVGGDGRPNTGSVDLEVNVTAATAGERTCNNAVEANAINGAIPWFGVPDPTGRASFGIYKAPIIYMRENY